MDSFLDGPKASQKLDMESATQWFLCSVINNNNLFVYIYIYIYIYIDDHPVHP
jgi:hypothetical protein